MSYLLIGLGNQGKKFESTRHNAGKAFVGWLREEGSASWRRKREEGEWEIVETECFMNESGGWVKRRMATKAKKVEKAEKSDNLSNLSNLSNLYNNLFVAHDDLDIPLGSYKIQFGKGPRLHKGILSIEQALGTKEFWRIRIGIDNRLKNTDSGEDYVLEKFRPEEKKVLELVFPEIRDKLLRDFKGI